MDRHIRVLSLLYIVGGATGGVLGVVFLFSLTPISNFLLALFSTRLMGSIPFAAMYLTGVSWVMVLIAIPSIVCGWGLRTYQDWARYMAIIVGLIGALDFPAGTVLSGYAMWVLLSPETEYLFLEPPVTHAPRR